MWFARGAGKEYIDRGDVASYDRQTGYFTKDNTWRELTLGHVVGYRSIWIHCRLRFQVLQLDRYINLRTMGNSNEVNMIQRNGYISNKVEDSEFWILTNYDGQLEYRMDTASYAFFDLVVLGWYE